MYPNDEFLDLVNEQDEIIGRMLRSELYAKGLRNYRVINAFVMNAEGKLWIPRRTADKAIFPRALDISAAGHVASGETYEEAFRREVREELAIDVNLLPHRLLGALTPKDGVHAFERVWELSMESVPDYNRDDFSEYFWLTPQELFQKLTTGDEAKSDLPKLVEIFYGDRL